MRRTHFDCVLFASTKLNQYLATPLTHFWGRGVCRPCHVSHIEEKRGGNGCFLPRSFRSIHCNDALGIRIKSFIFRTHLKCTRSHYTLRRHVLATAALVCRLIFAKRLWENADCENICQPKIRRRCVFAVDLILQRQQKSCYVEIHLRKVVFCHRENCLATQNVNVGGSRTRPLVGRQV